MTEHDWLGCTGSLGEMADFIAPKVSGRKLRLAACGFVRRIWHLLTDARAVVEEAELFADDARRGETLQRLAFRLPCIGERHWRSSNVIRQCSLHAASYTANPVARDSIGAGYFSCIAVAHWSAARAPVDARRQNEWTAAWARYQLDSKNNSPRGHPIQAYWDPVWLQAQRENHAACCDILRDVVGNPFRTTPIDPPWRTWNRGIITDMARGMYDQRKFDDMPVLADMLEDAGCVDHDLLCHCRHPISHTRGCWVVDGILGLK